MVIWNKYAISSLNFAREIALMSKLDKLKTFIGGGDAVAVVKTTGLEDYFTYLSTGGGAFIEFLSGHDLVGLNNLQGI